MMRLFHTILLILLSCATLSAQDTFQLAPPLLRYESVFFERSAKAVLLFAQAGTQIHYTTNGQTPTVADPVYQVPIVIKKNATTLKAKVFGTGFLPSDMVEATFYQKGKPLKGIKQSPPHKDYRGSGPTTLIDGNGGHTALDDHKWMGFLQDTVRLDLYLAKPTKVKQLLLEVLQNQGSWIFLPQKVEFFSQKSDTDALVLLGTDTFLPSEKDGEAHCRALVLNAKHRVKTTHLVVMIYPLARIPDWHSGKGTQAWFFMDEVRVY